MNKEKNNDNLLIFDLDGTLVDCKELHQISFRRAVYTEFPDAVFTNEEVEGYPTTKKIDILRKKGINLSDNIDQIKKKITNDLINGCVKHNSELKTLIDNLKEKYYITLCSNSREEFVNKCIKILDIEFDLVYHRDSGKIKPDPWMFNECMRRLNIQKSNTHIFEDSEIGLQAAYASGANVIPIGNNKHLIEILEKENNGFNS